MSNEDNEQSKSEENTDDKAEEDRNEAVENLVEEAKKVNAEIQAGLKERKELLDREEKLVARKEALAELGGGSPAGSKPIKKEETAREYAEKVMRGEI